MVTIESLHSLMLDDDNKLGELAAALSTSWGDRKINFELLTEIMDSPDHDLLVARNELKIPIGMAALSIIRGPVAGRVAYLEDFVVSPEARGQRVGTVLWWAIEDWCRDHQADRIEWTCNPKRVAAHGFYLAQGAEIRTTDVFRLDLDVDLDA